MNKNINHILREKQCVFWTSNIFDTLICEFKESKKNCAENNLYLYILEHSKNYIHKVKLFIESIIHLWKPLHKISANTCQLIWKEYTQSFSMSDRKTIVECIKLRLYSECDSADSARAEDLDDTADIFESAKSVESTDKTTDFQELTCKYNALMELYTQETEKYTALEKTHDDLAKNYCEIYKLHQFKCENHEYIKDLNDRLAKLIEEITSSRDLYKKLYENKSS